MNSNDRNLLRLVAERQQMLESDVIWNDQDGEGASTELLQVQSAILECDLRNELSYIIASRLLLSGDDDPNFADDFKNVLFENLRLSLKGINGQ